MVLNDKDLESDLWAKLKAHYEKRLDELRKKNDADLDEKDTAALRGQIKEVKVFLELGAPKPEFAKRVPGKP